MRTETVLHGQTTGNESALESVTVPAVFDNKQQRKDYRHKKMSSSQFNVNNSVVQGQKHAYRDTDINYRHEEDE